MSSAPEAVAHSASAQLLLLLIPEADVTYLHIRPSSRAGRIEKHRYRVRRYYRSRPTSVLICLLRSIQGSLEGLKLQTTYYRLHALEFSARGDSTQENGSEYRVRPQRPTSKSNMLPITAGTRYCG